MQSRPTRTSHRFPLRRALPALLCAVALAPSTAPAQQEASPREEGLRSPSVVQARPSRDRLPAAIAPVDGDTAPSAVRIGRTTSRLTSGTAVATWQPQGPAPSFFGQPEEITDSPISGALEAVEAHPTDADILWVGAVNGGIFRTDNATAASPHWTQQTDAAKSLSIAALELDPTDGSNDTLVAGIGATSSFATVNGGLTGILRTTNGGTSWTNPGSAGLADLSVSGVAPRGSSIVAAIAAAPAFASTGIWRSTNSGVSFTQISNGGGTGLPTGRAFDLVGDPATSTRIYTIIRDTGTPGSSGIYRSDDTGATWTKISDATQETLLNSPAADANLAASADGNALFAATCDSNGQLASLRRSGDPKTTTPAWTDLDLPGTTEQAAAFFGIHPGGQCSIHLSLVVDPANSQVVYIGGDRQPGADEGGGPGPTLPNSVGATQFSGRLFRVDASQSTGNQATPITHCKTALSGCKGSARTASGSAPHADSREMVFDANGDLIQTDDGGIYRHTNPAGTTGDWFSVIGNLGVVEQHDLAYDSLSEVLFSGNQDNGTTLQFSPGNSWWGQVLGGDGGDVAVAVGDPIPGQSTRYVSAQNLGNFLRVVHDSSGAIQSVVFPSLVSSGESLFVQFVTPVATNPFVPGSIMIGGSNRLFLSNDRGDNIATAISPACVSPCFPANSSVGGRTMQYGVATDTAAIAYVSGDLALGYNDADLANIYVTDPNGADTSFLTGIVMDPTESETFVVIDPDQVYRTTNTGNSYTEITGNLQSLDPGSLTSVEYVGTDLVVGGSRGVFTSTSASGFSTWSKLGTGLPNAPVYSLVYDASDDVLYAGTLGRGSWILGSSACPTVLDLTNQTLSSNQDFLALDSINTLDLIIDADIRFDAVNHVSLGSGTVVKSGAKLTVNVDSSLTCP